MNISKPVSRATAISLGVLSLFSLQNPLRADWNNNEVMKRQASFEVKDASIDDYILAVARAYRVNLVLDSSRVPQDAPPITQQVKDYSLWGGLQFFASRNGINAEQMGDGSTILLWQQPDLLLLVRGLVAGGEIKTPPADTPNRGLLLLNQRKIQPLVAAFFRDQKGWDGKRPFQATAAFDELPDELRARLVVQTRAGFWNLAGSKTSPQWFSDDFWKRARLRFTPGRNAAGKIQQELAVTGIVQRNEDGTTREEGVFISQPNQSFGQLLRPRVPKAAGVARKPSPDDVMAKSSLAGAYQPVAKVGLDLASEATLSQKVTLELKRRPLGEVIGALGEKSGVVLSLSPELNTKGTLLTLGITQMPVSEAMNALTRLLGLKWSKVAEGSYFGERGSGTLLDAQLLQARTLVPALLTSENPAFQARKTQEFEELRFNLTQALGQAALAKPEGAAFSDLPDDLQNELRSRVQLGLAPHFAETQSRLREKLDVLSGAWLVDLEVPAEMNKKVTLRGGRQIDIASSARVVVRSPSGQTLVSVGLLGAAQGGEAQLEP